MTHERSAFLLANYYLSLAGIFSGSPGFQASFTVLPFLVCFPLHVDLGCHTHFLILLSLPLPVCFFVEVVLAEVLLPVGFPIPISSLFLVHIPSKSNLVGFSL